MDAIIRGHNAQLRALPASPHADTALIAFWETVGPKARRAGLAAFLAVMTTTNARPMPACEGVPESSA
jgi:hypothetical protein